MKGTDPLGNFLSFPDPNGRRSARQFLEGSKQGLGVDERLAVAEVLNRPFDNAAKISFGECG